MIKVNLAPIDEIESPYWYLPEVLTFVFSIFLAIQGVDLYLDGIRGQVTKAEVSANGYLDGYNKLAPQIKRYESLEKEIGELDAIISAIRRITTSKLHKYKPIIVLEHLQNLKPENLWFSRLEVDLTDSKRLIKLKGKSIANLDVARFLTALISTRGETVDPSDLRTQIFFDTTSLEFMRKPLDGLDFMNSFAEFELISSFDERQVTPIGGELSVILKSFESKLNNFRILGG